MPTEEITSLASKAFKMGTTLWFTKKDKKEDMLDTLIACGQFSTCYNLLLYHQKIKKLISASDFDLNANKKYLKKKDAILSTLESKLKRDWEKFKSNPKWMVKELNREYDVFM